MSSSNFQIQEHILECQHIREYARATSSVQEDILKLAIKQYTPLDNLHSSDGDLTIIGAHANGFPKELYDPLWDDLLAQSKMNGFKIRSIWIADIAQQGQSGIVNEELLGDDPSWNDHARDMLHMINHFRSEMPTPIVGIGHSLGGNMLCNLSFMHPRLLSTVVLLDPVSASLQVLASFCLSNASPFYIPAASYLTDFSQVIQHQASTPFGPNPAQASTYRRDHWPSRDEAAASFQKSKFYQSWDPRVLAKWVQHGLRDTPSPLYPSTTGVTLTTTKHQECLTFLRPSWDAVSPDGKVIMKRDLVPDMAPDSMIKFPFYRPEPPNTLARLPELRPSALYIFGGESPMSRPEARKIKMECTGTGLGGSGGAARGRVGEVVLDGVGHLVAMEASDRCAEAAAKWLGQETKRFEVERKTYVEWTKQSQLAKSTLSEEWKKRIGVPLKPPKKSKL